MGIHPAKGFATMNSTTLTPNPVRKAVSAIAYHIGTFLQSSLRLRNEYAEKPLEGMSIEELEAVLFEHLPSVKAPNPPRIGGDLGLAGFDPEFAQQSRSSADIKACLDPEHPKRSSEIASILGTTKEAVDEIIDREGSGLKRGPGGWVHLED